MILSNLYFIYRIVVSLLSRGKHPAQGEHISNFAPFYEIDSTWDISTGHPINDGEVLGRRVFNTHLRWNQMPRKHNSQAKYIYVIRDGKDVVTSFFHHLSNQEGAFNGSFEEFFNEWLNGTLPYGKYIDHIKSWLLRAGIGKDNVLIVYYDKLKSDLNFELVRINSFLGLDPLMIDKVTGDDSEWINILRVVSFSYMKVDYFNFSIFYISIILITH